MGDDESEPHHVRLSGPDLALDKASYAMTEQPRTITITRARIVGRAGAAGPDAMAKIDEWLRDFIDL